MTRQDNKRVVDFDKVRQKRQRTAMVKRLLVLAGLGILIAASLMLNEILVEENITTTVSDLLSGIGGSGYPVNLPGGIIHQTAAAGDNLVVLNDTNLYVYSKKGKLRGDFQGMSDRTALLTGDNRLLTYEEGAKRYTIYSTSRMLLQQDTEYPLIAAGMNKRGDYAIASSSQDFICVVDVYDRKFQPIYQCKNVEDIVYSLAIDPKGTMLSTGWINGKDGVLCSGVDIYRFVNDQDREHRILLEDQLLLQLTFLSEDSIGVVTDRQCLVIGTDGEIRAAYDYDGRQILAHAWEGKQILLLLEDRDTRAREAVLLDTQLVEKGSHSSGEKILDMALTPRRVYLLEGENILSFDAEFRPLGSETVERTTRICAAGGQLYYMTRDEIQALGQNRAEEIPESSSDSEDMDDPEDLSEDEDDASASVYPWESGGDSSAETDSGQPEDELSEASEGSESAESTPQTESGGPEEAEGGSAP